jgi:hypothetical protein
MNLVSEFLQKKNSFFFHFSVQCQVRKLVFFLKKIFSSTSIHLVDWFQW